MANKYPAYGWGVVQKVYEDGSRKESLYPVFSTPSMMDPAPPEPVPLLTHAVVSVASALCRKCGGLRGEWMRGDEFSCSC